MNDKTIARVALVGLGPIGIEVARAVLGRPGIEILGAADPAPDKAGKDLRALVPVEGGGGPLPIAPSARELYAKSAATRGRRDVVLLCTGSRLESVAPQIEEAVSAGLHVVSTCEELSFPDLRHAGLARSLDAKAKEHRRRGPRHRSEPRARHGPSRARGRRRLRHRREAEGHARRGRREEAGTAPRQGGRRALREEFEKGVADRKLGHVGLSESAAMIAVGLGLPIEEISETIEPVLALRETGGVPEGRVLGLHQIARVRAAEEVKVELDLTMAVGVPEAFDRIEIQGDPPVNLTVTGGFHGDRATVGCVVNAIPFVVASPPGVQTVVSIPLFGLLPRSPERPRRA